MYKVPKVINMSFKERRCFLLSPLDSDTYACFWILWLESRHVCPTCEVPFRAYFFWPINSSFFSHFYHCNSSDTLFALHFRTIISERIYPNDSSCAYFVVAFLRGTCSYLSIFIWLYLSSARLYYVGIFYVGVSG